MTLAVMALLLVLWATGTSSASIWPIPVAVLLFWVAMQMGFRIRNRHVAR
jgi:hypothetical protein